MSIDVEWQSEQYKLNYPRLRAEFQARIDALEAERDELKRELDMDEALRGRMSKILENTANALHGGALENGLRGWSNLADLAESLKAERDAANIRLDAFAGNVLCDKHVHEANRMVARGKCPLCERDAENKRAEQAEADARRMSVADVEYGHRKMERVTALITKISGGGKMKTLVMLIVCLALLAAPTALISLNHPGAGLVGLGMMCGVLLVMPVVLILWALYQHALGSEQSPGGDPSVKRLPDAT